MTEKFSIISVIEHFVGTTIPQRGSGWSQLCCPIHSESNPSASFNEELGKLHCFGCGFHGDALDVIREKEGITNYLDQVAFAEEITGTILAGAGAAAKLPSRRLPVRISDGGSAGAGLQGPPPIAPGGRRRARRIVD